jgi:hypothetical protein
MTYLLSSTTGSVTSHPEASFSDQDNGRVQILNAQEVVATYTFYIQITEVTQTIFSNLLTLSV